MCLFITTRLASKAGLWISRKPLFKNKDTPNKNTKETNDYKQAANFKTACSIVQMSITSLRLPFLYIFWRKEVPAVSLE